MRRRRLGLALLVMVAIVIASHLGRADKLQREAAELEERIERIEAERIRWTPKTKVDHLPDTGVSL